MSMRSEDQRWDLLIAYDHPQPVTGTTISCAAPHPVGSCIMFDVVRRGDGSQHVFQIDTHLRMLVENLVGPDAREQHHTPACEVCITNNLVVSVHTNA